MSVCTPKSFDLTGKVALITGASYGIGFAIATAMANCGATIVFNDIKQELVDKGLAAYKEAGITAHGYVCDVTNEDAVNAMVKQITEEVGHINILVNNAGIIKRIPMCEMTAAQFRQVIDVDLNAPFIVAKAIIPGKKMPGMGGAMDLCVGAKHCIVCMEHTAKGNPKIFEKCRLPLTASHCVNKIITEMCVLEVTDKGLLMTEINPEFTVEQVQAATAAPITVSENLKSMVD